MNRNCIKFIYDETTRGQKKLENNVLYSPKRINLQPGEIKSINMKVKLKLPNNLVGTCTLLLSLTESNIKLLNSFHIAMDGVIASQNQPIDLPYVFAPEIQNQNMNRTFPLRKTRTWIFYYTE